LDSYPGNAAALTGWNAPCQQSNVDIFSSKINHHGGQDAPSADSRLVEGELKLQLDIKADKGPEPTPGFPLPCVLFKHVARCHMNKADYDTSTDGPRCAFIPAIHSTRCSWVWLESIMIPSKSKA
jgi:hypothetical protein